MGISNIKISGFLTYTEYICVVVYIYIYIMSYI